MSVNNESVNAYSVNEVPNKPLITIEAQVFEVEKNNLQKTRINPITIQQSLTENEVILKVDKFALTANNISYGVIGDALGYWRFFPVDQQKDDIKDNNHWGRLPVMGFADVVASNNNQINVGERVWGFMPMSTHVKIIAGNINERAFSDISPHREGLAPLYSSFERVNNNPFYKQKNENFEMLVRGLFTTSWLVDDFMDDNNYFDASQYLITSASSKTSIALAFAIKQRGKHPSIGITSSNNKKFVESLGCYDQVINYNDISSLNAGIPSVLVDMAGSQSTLSTIHNHFTDQLKYSCRIGATHHHDISVPNITTDKKLPGPLPTFFFAPTQLKKRTKDWGGNETMKQIGISLGHYIEFCNTIIKIKHTTNKNEIDDIYQRVLSGQADASIGQIISL